jgi:hypothetical protein
MKTLIEIIDETIEVYSNIENRSIVKEYYPYRGSRCVYKGPNGQRCAFSRVLTEEGVEKVSKYEDYKASSIINHYKVKKTDLKEEYRYHYHNTAFWDSLQSLHDKDSYWNIESTGLSEEGENFVKLLKEKYGDNN